MTIQKLFMANENTLNTVLFPALIERMQERNMSRKKNKNKKKERGRSTILTL